MEQPNIKILTPCYMGQVHAAYTQSLLNFYPYSLEHGILFSWETLPNCSLISLGRSSMLNTALKDDSWTHIMWIDADIQFMPQFIHSMILEDKDIVGGLYPKKAFPIDFASCPVPDGDHTDDLFETYFVATGFMLVKREVVEKMVEHYREELHMKYQSQDDIVHLFHPIIDRETDDLFLTEDYAFCKRARDIGFKCYVSKKFALPHIGTASYSIDEENEILERYEDMGLVKIHRDAERNYFSALQNK